MTEALHSWRKHLAPIGEVSTSPPSWLITGILPPGLTLLVGDPKTFKSTFALELIAAAVHGKCVAGQSKMRAVKAGGSAIYAAAEQSHGRLKHIYETRVARQTFKGKKETGRVNYDFSFLNDPWRWQVDQVEGEHDLAELHAELKPTLLVIDPLVYFHSHDENDPQLVRPLIPFRETALRHNLSVVIVHHAKKNQAGAGNRAQAAPGDFTRVRGTSALWAMADAGIMMTRLASGAVNVAAEFKDWPGTTWTWRPG